MDQLQEERGVTAVEAEYCPGPGQTWCHVGGDGVNVLEVTQSRFYHVLYMVKAIILVV